MSPYFLPIRMIFDTFHPPFSHKAKQDRETLINLHFSLFKTTWWDSETFVFLQTKCTSKSAHEYTRTNKSIDACWSLIGPQRLPFIVRFLRVDHWYNLGVSFYATILRVDSLWVFFEFPKSWYWLNPFFFFFLVITD